MGNEPFVCTRITITCLMFALIWMFFVWYMFILVTGHIDPSKYYRKIVKCEKDSNNYLGLVERVDETDFHLSFTHAVSVNGEDSVTMVKPQCDPGYTSTQENKSLRCPNGETNGEKMVQFILDLEGYCIAITSDESKDTDESRDTDETSEADEPNETDEPNQVEEPNEVEEPNAILLIGGANGNATDTIELFFPDHPERSRLLDKIPQLGSTNYDVALPVNSTTVLHLDSNSQGDGRLLNFIDATQTGGPHLVADEEVRALRTNMVAFRGAWNGKGQRIVCGGYWAYTDEIMKTCHLLSEDATAWLDFPSMNVGRQNFALGGFPDGDFIAAGGVQGELTAEIFVSKTGEWIDIANKSVVQRQTHGVVLSDGDSFLTCGGDMEPAWQTASCEIYRRSTGEWTPTASFNTYRGSFELIRMGTTIYAIGGQRGEPNADGPDDIEILREGSDVWETLPVTLKKTRKRHGAIAVYVPLEQN